MFPATSLPRFGVRRLVGALDFGVRTEFNFEKAIQSGAESPPSNWNSWQDLNPHLTRSKRAALPLSYRSERIADYRLLIANFETLGKRPIDNWQLKIGNDFGRGGQNRTVATSAQDSDACVTPHPVKVAQTLVCDDSYDWDDHRLSLCHLTSSFDTDHLLNLCNDFNQVFLVLHHRFD
jgi:hypothetical protein